MINNKTNIKQMMLCRNLILEFRKDYPRMEMQLAIVFLLIAELIAKNQPATSNTLSELACLTKSSISRNLRILSELGAKGANTPGLGWIRLTTNADHMSKKDIHLTEKGKEKLSSLFEIFNSQNGTT